MDKLKVIELSNGENVCVSILELTQIPDIEIIKNDYSPNTDIEAEFRNGFAAFLTELHKMYLSYLNEKASELCIEVIWATTSVNNQPYKAKIGLYLVLRTIGINKEAALEELEQATSACSLSLKLYKYSFSPCAYDVFFASLPNSEPLIMKSIVRNGREEKLFNYIMPSCFAFERLKAFATDMSGFVGSLIDHPNSVVSFSLIPTSYNSGEMTTLTQTTQMLDALNKGVMTQGVGTISYSVTEGIADTYRYYQANRNNALFLFNIVVIGDTTAANDITSKLLSYIAYDSSTTVGLRQIQLDEGEMQIQEKQYAFPWIANEVIINNCQRSISNRASATYENLYRFPHIITAEEASGLFRLPIGTQRVSAGLPINQSASGNKTFVENLINAGDIRIGSLRSSPKNEIGVSLKDFAKHMLVVGTPGSGKTTFSVSLLDRLWKNHNIPFLVIEPAKNEYRALIQSIPELQVFTPGKNYISPFVFNPFVPPKNVKLETYKSSLKTAFSAAVSMSTPLDKIFEETINNCYSDFRWLDTYTSDDKGSVFNISDFIKCFQQTFDEIGYTGDARNIGRAGIVRLNSLVNLFDNYYSIPIEDILKKPTVIELAAIENSDQKALIIALLLLSILAYVNANYIGEGSLRNVILLEEAHVLLDADTNAGQGDANPSAIAQGLVKRMLAEIRSYGVGLIIADQSPRKVSTDVVALTDMKMVFRLVESVDKQIIADSTNMSDAQIQRLTKLKPGEAFLFFNKLDEPEEVITPDYRLDNNISITLSDDGIKALTTYWNNREELLRPYPQCHLCRYCAKTCDYNRRILAREVARRIFTKYIKANAATKDPVEKVFGSISKLVIVELNDEVFTPELLLCVKVHLWRRIRYGTKLRVSDKTIENSLRK